ncbi:MAG: alpha/beta hydrolase [Anaerolineae bacterium]|nr:alpha/beta hydrolase [Anaerolineae bacterium]
MTHHPHFFVETVGPDTAPAVVFLHGGGVGGWMWREQARRLAHTYRCFLLDMPGLGLSRRTGPFSHVQAADLIAELIQSEAAGGKAHLVGLSEGAQVAVELLARHSGVAESAFISSALLKPVPTWGMSSRAMLSWSYRLFMAPLKNWDWWVRLNMRYSAGLPDVWFEPFKRSFQETTEEEFVEMLYAGLHYRMPPGLAACQARALVIAGAKEYAAMRASAHDLVKVLPNARGALLTMGPKSKLAEEHNWALTVPDLFNRALEAWLNGAPLPAELKDLP